MYSETTAPVDPYSDAYNAPPPSSAAPPLDPRDSVTVRGRSRSRSPMRGGRSPPPAYRSRRSPPPSRPKHAPVNPQPSNVLGVFGLSIRSTERDLDEEFSRFGRVEKVTIVYDQRSDRSRGFGFIKLASLEDAARCIQELNGVELNGRRIRVDYSVTERPHAPTPGEYMGHRRNTGRDYDRRDRGPYRESYRERDYRRDLDERERYYDRDRYDRYDRYSDKDRYSDRGRDRDPFGRDRDWRHRSPPPAGRYGSDRHRRSYSRSPPRGSSPTRMRDFELPPASAAALNGDPRW